MPVPTSACVAGNGGVCSPEQTPKGSRSTRGLQATGKAGRVNASEPLTTLRYPKPGEGGGSTWVQGWAAVRRPATAGLPVPAVWAPHPRSIEGTQSRSDLARGQRGNPDGVRAWLGRPTVREAHSPSGRRMTQQANAGAPKGDRTVRHLAAPPSGCPPGTGRIRGPGASARKGAHVGQVSR